MTMQFPGMSFPVEVGATILRGTSPSRIIAIGGYEPVVGPLLGEVVIENNGQSVQFQQAAAASYHVRHSTERHNRVLVSATFLDRRWKWRFSYVSARFNERLPDNSIRFSPIHPGYRRSAQEIFAYLLFAAADAGADVSAAPANVYPRCLWDHVPVDVALAELCRQTSCSLVLDQANQISVVRLGVGVPLSATPDKQAVSTAVGLGAMPQGIAIGCGPTWFQSRLLLQAVGLDKDNKIKPIDELSYKPAAGWVRQWPNAFPDVEQQYRHLAFQTVWRWYRVKGQAPTGSLTIPGRPEVVLSTDQYRLLPWLVEVGSMNDMPTRLPSRIWGEYYPQQDHPKNTPTKAPMPASFRIIQEMGIVEFAYPVWKESTDGEFVEPRIFLETGYHLAYPQGEGFVSLTPRAGTGFATATNDWVLPHPELWEAHRVTYGSDGIQVTGSMNNQATVGAEAGEYLSRAVTMVQGVQYSTDMLFGGIVGGNLDGLRAQTFIEYGQELPPVSRISQGIEADIFVDDPHVRRAYE